MLSQKMTKEILLYKYGQIEKNDVLSTIMVFNSTAVAVLNGGDAPLNLDMTEFREIPKIKEGEIRTQMEKTSKLWISLHKNISHFLENKDDSSLEYIIENNTSLLIEIDTIVGMLQFEAENRVIRLCIILLIVLIVTLPIFIYLAMSGTIQKHKKEIEEANRRFEFILDASKTSFEIIDKNYNLLFVDPGTEKKYGKPKGRKCYDYKMGLHDVCTDCNLAEIISDKKVSVSDRILQREGNRPVQVTSIPFCNEKGEWLVAEVNVDITDRKIAENELKLSREILRKSTDCLYVYDPLNRNILEVNETSCSKMGYTREEFLKLRIDDLDPFFPMDQWDAIVAKIKAAKDGIIVEAKHAHKNGTPIPVELSIRYLALSDKNLIVATSRDITERLKANAEIISAKMEAEEANMAKSEFLSRMSHELRTPMNAILGFAQLLNMGDLKPSKKRGVEHIIKGGKHLLNLINEVLDLTRIESGKLSLSLEPVKLGAIIRETLDIVQNLAIEKNVALKFVESTVNTSHVMADNQKLKQVLINLVNNAIKYNRDGGSVSVECSEFRVSGSKLNPKPGTSTPDSETKIRINVKDTGNGISPEGIQKLFMPFQRIGAEITGVEGTGLGLTVAKKLMEAMNGTIGVESELGVGSTFWIELPKTESQTETFERSGSLVKTGSVQLKEKGIIMYIEDNQSNIELVEQILETYNPEILLVTEIYGKLALKHANDYKPNLILLDLDLPDLHGSKVFELLQADENVKDIPVVIVSADAMTKQIDNMMKQGAKDYLTKPIDVERFLKVVEEFVGKGE